MTFYLPDDPKPRRANPAPADDSSLLDVAGAAWNAETVESDAWRKKAKTRAAVIKEIEGRLGSFAADMPIQSGPDVAAFGLDPSYQTYVDSPVALNPRQERQVLARARKAAAVNPADFGGTPLDEAQLEREVDRRLRAEEEEANRVLSMGGYGSGVAEFLGRGGRAATDEFGLGLMALGGSGGRALSMIGREALLGGVGEALVLPRRYDMAETLDIPDPDALASIATGVVFSGALAGAMKAAERGFQYALGRSKAVTDAVPPGGDPYDIHTAVDQAEAALVDGSPIPPPPPVTQGDLHSVAGRIIGIESGGNPFAQNPSSSAGGAGQFIDSTWLAMIHKHRPDLAIGRSNRQILEMKSDPKLSRQMVAAYAEEGRGLLVANGLSPDDGGIYLHHFLGPGDVVKVLRSDPGSPIAAILGPEKIAANRNIRYGGKFFPDFTVSDLRRWAEVKMGQAVDPGSAYRPGTRAGYTMPDEVVTPAGTRFSVQYEIVEASTLVKASGDLQPRDRSRASSAEQIAEMAARLDPARLMPGPETDRGAPIVGPDNIIESGNGRVAAINLAADQFPDRYDAYKAAIAEVMPIPEGVTRPILIARRTTDMTPEARAASVRESNSSSIAVMSGTEKAHADAAAISDRTLELYDPGFDLKAPENRTFFREMLRHLTQAERNALVDEHGIPNADGVRRLRAALFARAFDAPDITKILTEAEGGDLRGLTEALGDAAPAWAALRAEIAAGQLAPEFDTTPQLMEAVRLIGRAREAAARTGSTVRAAINDALAQPDLETGAVSAEAAGFVDLFYKGNRSRSQADVAAGLNRYVDEARRVGAAEASLFADLDAPTPKEIIDAIRRNDPETARALGSAGTGAGLDENSAGSGRSQSDDPGAGPGGSGGDGTGGGGGGNGQGPVDPEGPFGPIHYDLIDQPEAAIERLMADKTGEAFGAIDHPDLGPISFVYGDSKKGLAHIAEKHPEMLPRLPALLRTGDLRTDPNGLRRAYVADASDPANVAVLRLDYDGAEKTWLVTAFVDDQGSVVARQARMSNEPPVNAPSRIPDATGRSEGSISGSGIQPPDIRLVDDQSFALGASSPEAIAADHALLRDLAAAVAQADFYVPDGKDGTISARELLDDLSEDQELVDVISACTLGGAD